jgi:hypothetical protein
MPNLHALFVFTAVAAESLSQDIRYLVINNVVTLCNISVSTEVPNMKTSLAYFCHL